MVDIKFAKVKSEAKIPNKRDEDMGYDIYACFDENYIEIDPHETKGIPTGIASVCNAEYGFIVKERGSTGSKGMAIRAGVIDSGFRDEWKIFITNTSEKKLYISKLSKEEIKAKHLCPFREFIVYPYEKAIAQAILVPVPSTNVEEISYEELKNIKSERGLGMLGSSGK